MTRLEWSATASVWLGVGMFAVGFLTGIAQLVLAGLLAVIAALCFTAAGAYGDVLDDDDEFSPLRDDDATGLVD